MATMTKKITMTKRQLIHAISVEKGIHPLHVKQVVQAFLDKMIDTLAEGGRLEFRDFGVFEIVMRKQKIGRNPKKAGVPIVIPERAAVKFSAGKEMRSRTEKL